MVYGDLNVADIGALVGRGAWGIDVSKNPKLDGLLAKVVPLSPRRKEC